jgi:hypothetical protein
MVLLELLIYMCRFVNDVVILVVGAAVDRPLMFTELLCKIHPYRFRFAEIAIITAKLVNWCHIIAVIDVYLFGTSFHRMLFLCESSFRWFLFKHISHKYLFLRNRGSR